MPVPTEIRPSSPAAATAGALQVALLYAGFSGLWILLSDRAVELLFRDPATMTLVSILKGWIFVAVTATLLFVRVKRLVAEVASREAKLHALLHAIPDLVWLKSPGGAYLGCNRAFERFFGAREREILGRTDYDLVPRELAEFFRQKDQEVMAAGETRENDEWITLAETGQRVLLQTVKIPMYDETGGLIGVLGIGRDITEQRRLEAQLQQAQKMELVGRFAGGVAHDYNNMLGVILANADLLLDQAGPAARERKHVEDIIRAARHSAELTGQLLAFARQQPLNPRLMDLNDAVSGLLGVLRALVGPGIQLAWTPVPDPWRIRADPTQLDQVLTNLVGNARDAITGPGRIEVSTHNWAQGEGGWNAADLGPGDRVCLEISDNGGGMAPELLPHIFEPFFTSKPRGKGTGLGLAMVHEMVRQNEGLILVDSEPGRGTRFRLSFPRATS